MSLRNGLIANQITQFYGGNPIMAVQVVKVLARWNTGKLYQVHSGTKTCPTGLVATRGGEPDTPVVTTIADGGSGKKFLQWV